jgi:hypothetical protein
LTGIYLRVMPFCNVAATKSTTASRQSESP